MIHPGFSPALRVITGTLASPEQRAAAHAVLAGLDPTNTNPEDLLWASPGTPAETRRLTPDEEGVIAKIMQPEQWNGKRASRFDRWIGWASVAVIFLIGFDAGVTAALIVIGGGL